MRRVISFSKPVIRPEFCPNPECPWHDRERAKTDRWFQFYGFFTTQAGGKTRRFYCKHCGKTCSSRTFSLHYWTHRKIDFRNLDDRLNSCSGYRQIGRSLSISYRVIKNRVLRLARNYLNLMDKGLARFTLNEDIAFDGFESYLRNQYIPTNFNIAVGCTSQVPYAFTLSLLRRKGRMTEQQKRNRAIFDTVWRPPPRSLVSSCKTVFRDVLSLYMNRPTLTPFSIHTDEKKEYLRALESLPEFRHLSLLKLVFYKTTNSKVSRNYKNPLFPVNYIDREIRKNSAAHVRETVRGDREVTMTMSRMVITLGYHTFRKPYRIDNRVKNVDVQTHAEVVNLLHNRETKWAFDRLYTKRHLWSHQDLKARWMEEIWLRNKKNPPVVSFRTGIVLKKGQPGSGWFARHLVE